MGYELIIAEKPQAAQKIAFALADGKPIKETYQKVSYWNITHGKTDIMVAAAVGHVYSLVEKNKGGWKYPVFDIEWHEAHEVVKTSAFTKKYVSLLKKLAKRADDVTIATDYDIEGEVIGLNVMRFACGRKDAHRMKFSTLTKEDLVAAYEHKQNHIDWPLAHAGETRHILDWYWGINLSRALTLAVKKVKGGFKLLSAGRVQGPALKLFVEKEKEIRAFIPEPYNEIELNGVFEKADILAMHANGKMFDASVAEKIMGKVQGVKIANVSKLESRKFKQNPPTPFDLTTLQTEAHKCLRISPKDTLNHAQGLYSGGFISYPRTSSQKLPAKIGLKKIIQKLAANPAYAKQANTVLGFKQLKPNEGKKTDDAHPSIYPTGVPPSSLTDREAKLYDLIVKRFLAVFGQPATRETNKITLDVKGEPFMLEGTRTTDKQWHELYEPYVMLEDVELPAMKEKEKIAISKITKLNKQTNPPKRFTESSVIRALEKANLGTKATRANIVETLFSRGYVKGKPIEATELGIKTCEVLEKHAPGILDQAMTRKFEDEMEAIRKGSKTDEDVIVHAKKSLLTLLDEFKKHEQAIGEGLGEAEHTSYKIANTLGKCLQCTGELSIKKSKFGYFVGCTGYPDCKVTFSLPKNAKVGPSGETCGECQHPIVSAKFIRGPAQKVCINGRCVTWTQEWKEKQAQKVKALTDVQP